MKNFFLTLLLAFIFIGCGTDNQNPAPTEDFKPSFEGTIFGENVNTLTETNLQWSDYQSVMSYSDDNWQQTLILSTKFNGSFTTDSNSTRIRLLLPMVKSTLYPDSTNWNQYFKFDRVLAYCSKGRKDVRDSSSIFSINESFAINLNRKGKYYQSYTMKQLGSSIEIIDSEPIMLKDSDNKDYQAIKITLKIDINVRQAAAKREEGKIKGTLKLIYRYKYEHGEK